MANASQLPESLEAYAVEVASELAESTVSRRAREIKVLLRMSMLVGLEMELASTLNLLCDLAAEVVNFQRAAVYFWETESEAMRLHASRNWPAQDLWTSGRAIALNYWAARLARPLLLPASDPMAAGLLQQTEAGSVLVVPLFVRHQVSGALHLFGARADSFTDEDAQLLWMLSLIAEAMLARDDGNETLLRVAFNDFLTGLKTRGYFEQQLELELARAERRRTPVALLMADIDHFKRLNDRFGHPAGDIVLRDVAAVLTRELREIDTAARYGGEEFILLLPETDRQGAWLVAQRLRYGVEQARFFTGTPTHTSPGSASASSVEEAKHVTISIGVAMFPDEACNQRELIAASDAALYEAKAQGRNRAVIYSEIMNKKKVG